MWGNNLILKNVLHVPDLRMNLMSNGDLDDRDYTSKFLRVHRSSLKVNLLRQEERGVATSTGQLLEVPRVV